MSEFEKKKLEFEFNKFARMNFEKPRNCRNIDQTRFYIHELSNKIEEMESVHGYVPETAYTLLAQYNKVQNQFVYEHFKNTY